MKRLGLTGGIGAGKSTVSSMLGQLGAVIIDADVISRELMSAGSVLLGQVVEAFGPQILTETGELNRPALARLIFADEDQRQLLNSIVHPAVRARSQELAEAAAAEPGFSGIIVEDIPLLTETGQASRFDGVILVEADRQLRLDRLMQGRGMSLAETQARMDAQASDEQRRAIASWVIDNSGSLEETRRQVEDLWRELIAS